MTNMTHPSTDELTTMSFLMMACERPEVKVKYTVGQKVPWVGC